MSESAAVSGRGMLRPSLARRASVRRAGGANMPSKDITEMPAARYSGCTHRLAGAPHESPAACADIARLAA